MSSLTSRQKAIIIGGGVVAILFFLVLVGVLPGLKRGSGGKDVSLSLWGVYDEDDVWAEPISRFRASHLNVTVKYKQIPYDEYESELIDAFASGKGPDIFYIHHTWLPKFFDKITPMPKGKEWMTYSDYRDAFVDIVTEDFTRDQATIYAVPLYVDTLALYYNKDLFNAVGLAQPPQSWEEFQDASERMTMIDSNGNILRSGAAMGTARNINRSTDILALLMLQTFGDTPMVNAEGKKSHLSRSVTAQGENFSPGAESLRFYTDFANPTLRSYSWNRNQHYSIDAFVEGNLAMMLNYSHHMKTIRSRAPQLSFGIARAPQPKALVEQRRPVDYASYFGLAVARTQDKSKAEAAWRFLTFMAEREQQKAYQQATGLPPARRDLIATLTGDPDLGVFAKQALTARSWYQPDNVKIETIFADMIESVVDGMMVREALNRADGQITVLLRDVKEQDNEGE